MAIGDPAVASPRLLELRAQVALADAHRWEEQADVARRAAVLPAGTDTRALRIRARAHLRLASALGKVGNPHGAIAAYEALGALEVGTTDDELVEARQLAAYNRAVMIDDLGDARAALDAYDHALSVEPWAVTTPGRRLRRVRTLRNKALLLAGFGWWPHAVATHREIVDIAVSAPDAEVNVRGRASAFDLADALGRIGDHAAAAQTYAWIPTATALGFSREETKRAAALGKQAAKASRRR